MGAPFGGLPSTCARRRYAPGAASEVATPKWRPQRLAPRGKVPLRGALRARRGRQARAQTGPKSALSWGKFWATPASPEAEKGPHHRAQLWTRLKRGPSQGIAGAALGAQSGEKYFFLRGPNLVRPAGGPDPGEWADFGPKKGVSFSMIPLCP